MADEASKSFDWSEVHRRETLFWALLIGFLPVVLVSELLEGIGPPEAAMGAAYLIAVGVAMLRLLLARCPRCHGHVYHLNLVTGMPTRAGRCPRCGLERPG